MFKCNVCGREISQQDAVETAMIYGNQLCSSCRRNYEKQERDNIVEAMGTYQEVFEDVRI